MKLAGPLSGLKKNDIMSKEIRKINDEKGI